MAVGGGGKGDRLGIGPLWRAFGDFPRVGKVTLPAWLPYFSYVPRTFRSARSSTRLFIHIRASSM